MEDSGEDDCDSLAFKIFSISCRRVISANGSCEDER
jgi:hypothetical protein